MTRFARLTLLAAFVAAGSGAGFADTFSIASYGTTATAPAGVGNSALKYSGNNGQTYDIGTGGVWTAPVGNSSWVSYNQNTYPGGSVTPKNGIYTYTSTFTDTTPGTSSGSITVMADDTTSVFLNGTEITSAAAPIPAAHCTAATPNCTTPVTFDLTGFKSGLNTLSFDVDQDFDHASGLDFSGYVSTAPTPEPTSLMLLGSGLLGVCGQVYRRRRA